MIKCRIEIRSSRGLESFEGDYKSTMTALLDALFRANIGDRVSVRAI